MNAKEIIKTAVENKKVVYLGKKENRTIYKVTFFYCDPNGTEEVYIVSDENVLENVIEEFSNGCESLFAVAYTEIGKEI